MNILYLSKLEGNAWPVNRQNPVRCGNFNISMETDDRTTHYHLPTMHATHVTEVSYQIKDTKRYVQSDIFCSQIEVTLKRNYRHFDEIFISGRTEILSKWQYPVQPVKKSSLKDDFSTLVQWYSSSVELTRKSCLSHCSEAVLACPTFCRRYIQVQFLISICFDSLQANNRQTSNIGRTLVVINFLSLRCSWSIACRRCSNYIFILDFTPGFNRLGKNNCKARRETFQLWDLVRLILDIWRYIAHGGCNEPVD